jgi:hypothetical protein
MTIRFNTRWLAMAGALMMLAGIYASGPFFWLTTRILVQKQFSDVVLATAENWGALANLIVAIFLSTARRRGWMSWSATTSMFVFLTVYAVLLAGAAADLFDSRAFLVFGSVSRIAFIPLTVLVAAEGIGSASTAATIASLMYLGGAAVLQPVASELATANPAFGFAVGAATTALAVFGTLLVRRFGAPAVGEGEGEVGLPGPGLFGLLVGAYLLLQIGYFARDTFSISICALMGVSGDGIGWWASASTVGEAAVAVAFLCWPLAPAIWRNWLAPRALFLGGRATLVAFAAFSAALGVTALGAGQLLTPFIFGVRVAVEGPAAGLLERIAEGYIFSVFALLRHAQSPALLFDAASRLIPILGRALLYVGLSVREAYLGMAVIGFLGLVLAYLGRHSVAHFFIEVLGGGYLPLAQPLRATKGNTVFPPDKRAWHARRARRSGRPQPPADVSLQRAK